MMSPYCMQMVEDSSITSGEMTTCHASEQKTKFQLTATREQAAREKKQADRDKEEMWKYLETVQRELEKATIAQVSCPARPFLAKVHL